MLMRCCLAPLALVLLTGPVFAKVLPPAGTDWKALLTETIEAHGCTMSDEDARSILPPLGFSEDWTVVIVDEMLAEGSAVLDETTSELTVKTGKCP